LSELRNLSAVTPSGVVQTNSGSLYWLFPTKLTKSVAGFIADVASEEESSSVSSVLASFAKP
jgi:hypothetical protein